MCIVAALMGTFYIAMPLTIIGGRFYEEYMDMEQHEKERKREEKMQLELKELDKAAGTDGRRNSVQIRDLSQMSTIKGMLKARREKLLEVEESPQLQKYVQECYDMCQIKIPTKEDFEVFDKTHKETMIVMARKLVHDTAIHLHGFARQWAGDEGESNFLG